MRGNRRITIVYPTGKVPATPKALERWLIRSYQDLTTYELRTFLRAEGLPRFKLGDVKTDLVARLATHDAATLLAKANVRRVA